MKAISLSPAGNQEIVDLWTHAFSETPFIPGLVDTPQKTRVVMEAGLHYCRGMRSAEFVGIRDEMSARLVCAAAAIDASESPHILTSLKFAFDIIRFLGFIPGFTTLQQFLIARKAMPPFSGKNVELYALASDPGEQQKGYGRFLLRHLCSMYKARGYDGMTLFVEGYTPAHKFYLKEGFVECREFEVRGIKLFWMKTDF